ICDTATTTEVLMALSVESREKVEEMIASVERAGGKEYMEAREYGWMYQKAFLDLDGHHWEIFFMDESQVPSN
ncbi:MAG: glyoxalase/bleomycin resistance/extradiol dioxygenase family protein, partial [Flavobacterium sp.]